MNLNNNAIGVCSNILKCMLGKEIRHAMQDDHLNVLMMYVIHRWPSTRTEIKEEL